MMCRLFHGKHTSRCALHAITAGLVVLIRQDLTAAGHDQAPSVSYHGGAADMNKGARALRPDAVSAIEKRRAAINDKSGKRSARDRGNAMPGIAGNYAVSHLNNDRSCADCALGKYALAVVVLHLNAGEHGPHRALPADANPAAHATAVVPDHAVGHVELASSARGRIEKDTCAGRTALETGDAAV